MEEPDVALVTVRLRFTTPDADMQVARPNRSFGPGHACALVVSRRLDGGVTAIDEVVATVDEACFVAEQEGGYIGNFLGATQPA